MSQGFKVGQIVWLNSGSPELTVAEIFGDGEIDVTWFDGGENRTMTADVACFNGGSPLTNEAPTGYRPDGHEDV